MTNATSLPTLDETGDLTPLVLAATTSETGAPAATAELDPSGPHGTLLVTFTRVVDAKAFAAKVAAILPPAPVPPTIETDDADAVVEDSERE